MNPCARIALVEDDNDLLNSTQEYLRLAGFSVWGAGSAEEFYRRFTAEPTDIVVLDIGLPGEDGLSVSQLLKKNPHVAVIIVSARDSTEDRLSGLRAGADRYLVKPVNMAELAANIDAVVNRLALHSDRPLLELPRPGRETRRRPDGGADRQDQWCLTLQNWFLSAPDGRRLKLTAREFALLHRLITVRGQAVPKSTLADEIFGARISTSPERLNVLIARLRKKAVQELGQELPIKTAHQIGYAFTAPAFLSQSQD